MGGALCGVPWRVDGGSEAGEFFAFALPAVWVAVVVRAERIADERANLDVVFEAGAEPRAVGAAALDIAAADDEAGDVAGVGAAEEVVVGGPAPALDGLIVAACGDEAP
jgi:hypothetical protein